MRSIVAIGTLALVSLTSIASAAETCTQRRNACVAGETSRGQYVKGSSSCDRAFPICMKTGVWDTTAGGRFGRRIEGMIKR